MSPKPTLLVAALSLLLFLHGMGQPPKPGQLSISNAAFKKIILKGSPDFLAVDGDDIWVLNIGRIEKLSANSKKPLVTVHIPDACGALIVGFNSVWVASCREGSVYRVDHATGKIRSVIPCGVSDANGEISLAIGAGSLWILTDSAGTLTRIDPATNKVQARIPVMANSYCAVYGYHSVWVTNTANNSVQRIDPEKNKVLETIKVGNTPRFLAAGANGIWTLNQKDGTVSRIDPGSNKEVAVIDTGVPGTGGDIAAGRNFVWVRAKERLLQKIDPRTNQVQAVYSPPAGSGAVRITNHFVWLTAHDQQTIWVVKN